MPSFGSKALSAFSKGEREREREMKIYKNYNNLGIILLGKFLPMLSIKLDT